MKNSIIQIFFALFVTGSISSCHDHDDFVSPLREEVRVGFDSTTVAVLEKEEQKIIQLSFDRKTTRNGVLTLSVSDATQSRFTMEPAVSNGQIVVNVEENQQSVTIKIKPVNNSLHEGSLEFTVSISSTTSGFTIGDRKSVLIKLYDDEMMEVKANFVQGERTVAENAIAGKTYSISLSEKLTQSGSIDISLQSAKAVYGTHFRTIPSASDGKVILTPAIGESQATITVIPIDNSIISGELEITLTITGATGAITKGDKLNHFVTIIDDELINKPKGYESSGGGWALKKIYEYDAVGRIKYANIEKSTPATSSHTETYYYDNDSRIQRINRYPQIDVLFSWSHNRIVKSETIENGTTKEYIEYDYDANGNVSGTANYFRQPDGQFKLGFLNIYLYFFDGNLHTSQTYIPAAGSEELILISTRTFDQYIDRENPFPMVDILPTVKTQSKLPSIYTVEENGLTLSYSLTYEFRGDGLVLKRIARGANSSEITQYLYY